jgi:hypothetical protein
MGAASASDHDAVPYTSLPLSEVTGANNQRVAGAGQLRGALCETGVAQLESPLNREPVALRPEPMLVSRAASYFPQSVRDTVSLRVPAALASDVAGGAARASSSSPRRARSTLSSAPSARQALRTSRTSA